MENLENPSQPQQTQPEQETQPAQPTQPAAEESQEQPEGVVQPPKYTFLSLITRTVAGFGGGIAGTLILLIIYILSVSVIAPVLAPSEEALEVSPLFLFVLMGMIFAATLASNLISPLFISFTQKDKYRRITTTLFQIFIVNIVIFIILIPIYFISSGIGLEFTSYAAGLQIAFGVLASALIFEIISNYKYAILGVYSTMIAILTGIAFNIILFQATGNATILLFVALPVLWGGVGFVHGVLIMLYDWVVRTWGTDFLATEQEYSKDYGIAEPEIETVVDIEPPKDEEGVEFLRKEEGEEEEPKVESEGESGEEPEQQNPEQQA